MVKGGPLSKQYPGWKNGRVVVWTVTTVVAVSLRSLEPRFQISYMKPRSEDRQFITSIFFYSYPFQVRRWIGSKAGTRPVNFKRPIGSLQSRETRDLWRSSKYGNRKEKLTFHVGPNVDLNQKWQGEVSSLSIVGFHYNTVHSNTTLHAAHQ